MYYLVESKGHITNFPDTSLVVVKWSAKWCQPCKRIQKQYDHLESQFPNKRVVCTIADVNQCPQFSKKHNVEFMPTFTIFNKEQLIGTYKSLDMVREILLKHL